MIAIMTLKPLESLFKSVQLRRAGLALCLWGEAGIGKTHLAGVLARDSGLKSVKAQANASLLEMTRALPMPKKLPLWAQRLPEQLTNLGHLEAVQAAELVGVLLSQSAPIILWVEDVHESKPERLEFWQKLAGIVAHSKGVALLTTSRAALLTPFVSHRVLPMSLEESRLTLEAELGTAIPAEALGWIQARAAGNPLFTLEYFRSLARAGFLWNDARRWRWRTPENDLMPTTVEALISRSLLEALDLPALEKALKAKALLFAGANDSLWANVAELELQELGHLKLELERRGILVDGHFVHPLFREVALESLTPLERQTFARRAIQALEMDAPELAAELIQDAALLPSEAFALLERAAARTENSLQAARLKARAVEFVELEERGALAFEAANLLEPFDLQQAEQLMAQAVQLQHDFEAHYGWIVLLVRLGKIEQATQVFSQLSTAERESKRGLETRLFLQYRQADDAGVVNTWRNELQASTDIDPSALSYLTHALANTGQTELAFEIALNALERPNLSARQRGQLLEVCGIFEFNRSNYREAHHLLSTELEILQSSHQEHRARNALCYRALASQELGWFDQSIPDLQLAAQLAALSGSLENIAYIQVLLGGQWFELGQYDQAEEILLEAANMLTRIPLSHVHADLEASLSDYYREVKTPTSGILALQHAQTALKLARRLNSPLHLSEALFCAALTEAKFGSLERALGLVKESLVFAEQHSEPRIVSNAIWAEAVSLEVLGQPQDALRQYQHALTAVQESNHSLRRQKIVLEIHRLDHDVQAAQNQLLWFEERGLRHGINLVLRAFPELVSDPTSQQIPNHEQNALRIEVLGSMRLFDHNQLQTNKSAKRQELLAYLLEAQLAGRAEVSALELAEMLYPNSFEDAALTSVKKMVHLIRSGFSKAAIQTTTNGYALGNVDSDVGRFLASGDTRLWRGQYLENIDIQNPDTTIREVVYKKLAASIGQQLELDPTEAARVARIWLEAEPYDQQALAFTLQALRASDNHRSLNRVYEQAKERLLEVGEQLPEDWRTFLERASSA